METKANYVLIGAFTLAVVVGVFGFVYWFQNIGGTGERAFYRIVFDDSVSGLRTGGAVLFNGIKVGEVTDLKLNPEKPKQVIATISIDKSVAVRPDMQIGMEFQGLTGIASLALKGGSPNLPALAGPKDNPPVLMAPPGATTDVTQAARDVMRKLDEFITENQKAFKSAVENIDRFTGALARNSERIDRIAEGLQNLTGGEDGKSGEINEAARSIKQLADHLDQRTAEITAGVNRLTLSGAREIQTLSTDARRTLSTIDRAVQNFDRNPSRLIWGGSSGSSLPEYNGRR
jgi:phospholipid/cholesterol/gamma-HCH transport system substrate-binding protein